VDARGLGLKDQVLLAALACSGGNFDQTFTSEDLLVRAWKAEKPAWGLRGYEEEYPDADKIHKELDGRGAANKGIIGLGYVERVHNRVYRITPAGLMAGSTLRPADPIVREKAGRTLEHEIKKILEHPVFRAWLQNPASPRHFRDAGHFWGIAPGMPPGTVRERVEGVERTLQAASAFLAQTGSREVTEQRGKILFQSEDIRRSLEFHECLKGRFARDLSLLAPSFRRVEA
jgi:hypothetical protein